jgi:hypothetical protein
MYAVLLMWSAAQAEPQSTLQTPVSEQAVGPVILCDPGKFRFSIRAVDEQRPDATYPQRVVIDLTTLSEMLPGWSGSPDILAPLIRYVRCGPYTIKLEGDAYNANVQGESGAYDPFAAVSVIRGNRMVYGPVRLTECDRTLPRAAPCPDGYTIRIDGRYDAARRRLDLTATTSSTQDDDPATRQTIVRKSSEDDDLTSWPKGYP